jgi:hypothetical protein
MKRWIVHAALLRTIEASLQTGDLLLFSGKGFASAGIKWLLGSTWSHVGLVVRSAGHGRQALLWEATPCRDLVDVVSGRPAGGARLVRLRDRLATFPGAVAVRQLSRPLAPTQEERLAATLWELHGRPYERSWLELILAVSDRIDLGRENLTSLFCSELVAETYQRIGLLDDHMQGGLPSNEYTPRHFSAAHDLPLRRGFALGPEIRLDRVGTVPEMALAT